MRPHRLSLCCSLKAALLWRGGSGKLDPAMTHYADLPCYVALDVLSFCPVGKALYYDIGSGNRVD